MKSSATVLILAILLTSCATTENASNGRRNVSGPSSATSANRADAGSDASKGRGSGGGLWEQLAAARVAKENRVEATAERNERIGRQLRAARDSMPAAWREAMPKWWGAFLDQQPDWATDIRHEWVALGDDAVDILVQNLLVVMVRAYDIHNGVMFKHARNELFWLREHSAPYLVAALAESHGDDVIRNHCVTLLTPMGSEVVPHIMRAWDGADLKGRRSLMRAAEKLGLAETTPFFQKVIADEDDFMLRIAAIQGIGKSADPRGTDSLIRCLGDEDISVRKFASMYMGAMKSRRAVSPLIDCLLAAERRSSPDNREVEVIVNCRRSLRQLTGVSFNTGRQWDAWRRRNER